MIDDTDPDETTAANFADWLLDLIFRPPDDTPGDGASATPRDRRFAISPAEPADFSDPIFDDDDIDRN